jgi:hypothetical protein
MQAIMSTNNYVYRTLPSSYAGLFVRSYVRFTALPTPWSGRNIIDLLDGGSNTRLSAFVVNYGGSYRWALWAGTTLTYSAVVNVNQWYCVEVEYNANTDVHRLFIDGSLVLTSNDARSESIGRVAVGSVSQAWGSGWSSGAVGYFDSVVVNTSYIGP